MPGQFWVKTIKELKKKKKSWGSKEESGFSFAFTLPVPLFTLRIYIFSTLTEKGFEGFYRHKQLENGWQVSPHCLFYPQMCTSKTHCSYVVFSFYLTLVSSSLAFRIFYPKSQQSALKAAILYPKIIISYSSKLQELCIQWRRQKRKKNQIMWIYLTARCTTSSRSLNNFECWEKYIIRLNSKYLCFIDFFWSNYPFLITYKSCLAELCYAPVFASV